MKLYRPGAVPWAWSQLLYHALPRLGREGLVLCRPDAPYVCVGYHQDLAWEVDLDHCRARGIPVFRREVAGGTVYLDGRQVFYQLVLHRRSPAVPLGRDAFFRRFLSPVVEALEVLGLSARIAPPCDIRVGGRKISGNGAGEIGDYVVLVGNLLLDFDFGAMARVLALPGEPVREVVRGEMERALTTLARELPEPPAPEAVEEALARAFTRALPGLGPGALDPGLQGKVRELEPAFLSPGWLLEPGRKLPYREVKIAEGTVVYAVARGGAPPLVIVTRGGRVAGVGWGGEPGEARRFLGRRLLVDRLRRWARAGRGGPGSASGLLSEVTA